VLKHNVGVNEVELITPKQSQVLELIDTVLATVEVLVVLPGKVNHGSSDVDTDAVLEMFTQRLSHSSNAATKIESPTPRDCKRQ